MGFLNLIFAHLFAVVQPCSFSVNGSSGFINSSGVKDYDRTCTWIITVPSNHTAPSNWNLRYFVYLMIPGMVYLMIPSWVKLRSRSMTEKGKMIPFWEFLLGQDSPSSYKQVVSSWCSLYKKTLAGPHVTLREVL